MEILFKVDVTNENGVIKKDHDILIKAGTILEFDPVPERVQTFIKMGVAAESSLEADPGAPENPETKTEGIALEELTKAELESFAKENDLGIDFPAKATKSEMIDLIEAALKADEK